MTERFINFIAIDIIKQCLEASGLEGTDDGKRILDIKNNIQRTIARLRVNRGKPWSAEQTLRFQILSWLREAGCYTCSGKARQLHHVYVKGSKHPLTKGFHLGTAVYKNVPDEIWFAEIHKCLPICKACHKMIHHGKLSLIIPGWLK